MRLVEKGDGVFELKERDGEIELRLELMENFHVNLKITNNKKLIMRSNYYKVIDGIGYDRLEMSLDQHEYEKIINKIKELNEATNTAEILKQFLIILKEISDILQNRLETLIKNKAHELTMLVLNDHEKIVKRVIKNLDFCIINRRYFGLKVSEEEINKYVEKIRELVYTSVNKIKENKDLREKLIEHVEDELWAKLFG